MAREQDPVETAADGDVDLYDVATWDERTSLDGLAVAIYRLIVGTARAVTVLVALLLLVIVGGFSALTTPEIGVLTALSAIPALGLAAYVWYSDATSNEPLSLLVGTFLLGVLTANFAAVVNTLVPAGVTGLLGATGILTSQPGPVLVGAGTVLFFFLVVGPVEETVKLLAVRLYAYRRDEFDTVVDGAVYGAMAGLGFAFIENSLYIAQNVDAMSVDFGLSLIGAGGGITAVRALAGPGHVIYSAFAGYYLGLAKFNRENAGPIIIKGLLVAALIHATYNSTVGLGAGIIAAFTPLGGIAAFFAYVLVFDGVFGAILLRKIRRYGQTYRRLHEQDSVDESARRPEATEFE
jgi:RsiW-degrading membrane proteinase PrsW (M82 family)